MSSPLPAVLAFSASDPTGGAGMQADLLTIASLGCHPLTVLTALTAQDTHGVDGLRSIEPEWVSRQALRLLEDIPVAAFKLGVLGSARNAERVATIVAAHPRTPLVLDPVLASGRGDLLADGDVARTLRSSLLPLTTVLTPNSLEARALARAAPDAPLADCARALTAAGCRYVLITGTHEPGAPVVNRLYDAHGVASEASWERLPGSYHGSGCTLAAALASFLARGMDVPEAAGAAQEYTWKALAAGFRPGQGQWIPNRLFGAP